MSQRSVLLGTEAWPNAGRGHHARLATVGDALRARGWQVIQPPADSTPRLAPRTDRLGDGSFAETMAGFGLDDTEGMKARMEGWMLHLGAALPDLVIADLSPHLVLAARDRFPVLTVGNGFFLPPPGLSPLPALPGLGAPRIDQDRLLAGINTVLDDFGRPALSRLSEVMSGDRPMVMVPEPLDPYRGQRAIPRHDVILPPGVHGRGTGGSAIFAYASGSTPMAQRVHIAEAMTLLSQPRIAVLPDLPAQVAGRLHDSGTRLIQHNLPLADIAAQARLVVHTGSLGLAAAMLHAGVPQLALHTDGEKSLTAAALAEIGVGKQMRLDTMPPVPEVAEAIRKASMDRSMQAAAAAQACAPWTDPIPALVAAAEDLAA
ncbi:hypothetical protein BOO69_09005 [Sulfitobacter alexandrii]|uniref:Erythromycin biosynthesis protein CIII-like C-terminal domain-containing protein n=1 Tax=Sulfitobacter alexandrii TaxID=1917485 RepID=A0A1J0WHC8_9RHOB|nr:nucleotide disphospho-sugar-binding domain-containing protein [Sulfitobacter alexandrii]APE43534.1 hypothetical protein BOO69_09005 [Sulfitobacter alexandrii]